MSELHVVPLPRGEWAVRAEGDREPLSLHGDATAAVRAAADRARTTQATRVILHDRYGRTHATGRHPAMGRGSLSSHA